MKTINERIQERRKELGLTLEEVAQLVGLNRSTIMKYEKGNTEKLPTNYLIPIAKALRCSPTYLLGIEDEIYENKIEYTKIPLYSELCCGNGGFVDDNIVRYVDVPSYGLNPHKEYFCQIASGDSMINAGINDGDLLIFEKTPIVQDNEIGCFCIDDNVATCKKFKKSGSIISLLPMNSKYDPIIIDLANGNLRCLGKLKYSVREY